MDELSDNGEAMIPPKSPVYVETDKCKIHLESLHHDFPALLSFINNTSFVGPGTFASDSEAIANYFADFHILLTAQSLQADLKAEIESQVSNTAKPSLNINQRGEQSLP